MKTPQQILADHDIRGGGSKVAYTTTCPHCSHIRHKKGAPCLSVLIDHRGVRWRCHHCTWSGGQFYDAASSQPGAESAPAIKHPPADNDRERIKRARDLWSQSLDPTGTLVEHYLAGRDDLRLLDGMAGRVVRFHAACPWKTDDDELIHVSAMITAMTDIRTNELRAIQRTALDRNGTKIGRKMMGVAAGAAIKLSADEDVTQGVGITEGFETALKVLMCGWAPVWALGSAHAIETFPVLPGIECLTAFADNDTSCAGQRAARICARRWRNAGLEAVIRVPKKTDTDWNDMRLA